MSLEKTNKKLFQSVFTDFFDQDNFFINPLLGKGLEQSLPPVNIKENAKEFNIEFAVPGFKKNDFKISVNGTTLTIRAEKQEEKKEEKEYFTRKEFSFNSFVRNFTLPSSVIGEKVEAKYNDGILKLNIPKKEEAKSLPNKEIKVE
jgi:HSP20 family protein